MIIANQIAGMESKFRKKDVTIKIKITEMDAQIYVLLSQDIVALAQVHLFVEAAETQG